MLTAVYSFLSSTLGVIIHSCLTIILLGLVMYYAIDNYRMRLKIKQQHVQLAEKTLEIGNLKLAMKEAQVVAAALSDKLRAAEEASVASKKALRSQIIRLKSAKPSDNADSVKMYLLNGRTD